MLPRVKSTFLRTLSVGSALMMVLLSSGLPANAQTEEMVSATATTVECEKLKRPLVSGMTISSTCALLQELQPADPLWVKIEVANLTSDDPVQFLALNEPTIDNLDTVTGIIETLPLKPTPLPAPVIAATRQPQVKSTSFGSGVEQWRSLVATYFPASEVDKALRIMSCESKGGDPNAVNPTSGASGLFQHMPKYWAERSKGAGWGGANIMDPTANVAVAAWMVYKMRGGGWSHWVCKG